MSLDIHTNIYLSHQQKLAYKAIPRQLRMISQWYPPQNQETSAAIDANRDVLEGFLPMDAGQGGLSIEAKEIGLFNVLVNDSAVMMGVMPIDPVTKHASSSKTVFHAKDRELLAFSIEGMAYARRILRFVNLRYERYGEISVVFAWWEKKLNLTPSPKWVSLREVALKAGTEAPRACHWMATLQ